MQFLDAILQVMDAIFLQFCNSWMQFMDSFLKQRDKNRTAIEFLPDTCQLQRYFISTNVFHIDEQWISRKNFAEENIEFNENSTNSMPKRILHQSRNS